MKMVTIPQEEWPKIVSKYKSGELITDIAREYKVPAPMVTYILLQSGIREAGNATEWDADPAA